MIWLSFSRIKINIIQVYASTVKCQKKAEKFQHELETVLKLPKKRVVNLTLSNFNVIVGRECCRDVVGKCQK